VVERWDTLRTRAGPAGVTAIPAIAATATIDVNVTRNTQLDMRTPPLRRERTAVKSLTRSADL